MTGFKTERRRLKPMMERKRRARINRSLEQLKDVIVDSNGGILPRLDKARILELTVDYLQKKSLRGSASTGDERFKAGYIRCANEVTSFLHDKVDDGKLTQIIQYLFTLTATLKRQTERTPQKHQSPASTVLRKQQGENVNLASPGQVTANPAFHELKAFHSRKQPVESTRNPSAKSQLCDFTSNQIPTFCQQSQPRKILLPKSPSFSAHLSLETLIPRKIMEGCSKVEVDERSRSRRHDSVCSSTTSGPSIDIDSSSDDEVFTRRPAHPLQPKMAAKWMDVDDNETGSCENSNSDDDSNTSDVFYIDCQSASDTERDSSLNLTNNNRANVVNKQENERSPSGLHDNRQDPSGSMWRPW